MTDENFYVEKNGLGYTFRSDGKLLSRVPVAAPAVAAAPADPPITWTEVGALVVGVDRYQTPVASCSACGALVVCLGIDDNRSEHESFHASLRPGGSGGKP